MINSLYNFQKLNLHSLEPSIHLSKFNKISSIKFDIAFVAQSQSASNLDVILIKPCHSMTIYCTYTQQSHTVINATKARIVSIFNGKHLQCIKAYWPALIVSHGLTCDKN